MLVESLVDDEFRMLLISEPYDTRSDKLLILVKGNQLLHDLTFFLRRSANMYECVNGFVSEVPDYPLARAICMADAQTLIEQKLSMLPIEKIRSAEWQNGITQALQNWIEQPLKNAEFKCPI